MKQLFDAVIFDLDGTLVDSMWVWTKIDEVYLGRFGFEVPNTLQAEFEGMSFTETALYVKERFNIPDDVEAIKAEWNKLAFEFYQKQVPLKTSVLAFLDYLKEQDIKVGIATSNSHELVNAVLEAHGIRECFEVICTSCEVERGKPYPYIYQRVAEKLGVNVHRCLAFEDVPNGVLATKRAGMTVCAIKDRQNEETEARLHKEAHYFIEDYSKVIEYFQKNA